MRREQRDTFCPRLKAAVGRRDVEEFSKIANLLACYTVNNPTFCTFIFVNMTRKPRVVLKHSIVLVCGCTATTIDLSAVILIRHTVTSPQS